MNRMTTGAFDRAGPHQAATRLRQLLEQQRERNAAAPGDGRVDGEAEQLELAALVEEHARLFEITLSSIVDFAYILDRDGRFLYANKPLLDLWGLGPGDAVGRNFFDLDYPPDLAARLHRQIQEVVATGTTVRDETPYTSPTGTQGVYEYIFTPVWGADGRVDVVAGSTRDITARKRTELELESIVARHRFLLALDDALRPLVEPAEITERAAALLGAHLRVSRLAYATVEDDGEAFLVTGDYLSGRARGAERHLFDQFGAVCLRLMRAGEPYVVTDSHDSRVDEGDRAAFAVAGIRAVVCVPLLKSGRFVAAMAVHDDTPRAWSDAEVQLVQQVASRCWESIERARLMRTLQERAAQTEREAREQSEEQKRLLYSLFLQAPTLIAILRGPDHVVELANPRICAAWGRPLEAVKDRPLFEGLPELRDQPFRTLLGEVFTSGLAHVGTETPAQFDRGGTTETLYYNFVYSPFRNVAGEIEGVFVIASDVTVQVRARQELDDLRLAAEAANRAKDEFLAMLGHELRNPLSPILTALQLMKLRGEASNERERIVIERQVRHLTRLIDDLLDVSRIAQGKVELRTEVMELADVVAKALELTAPLFEERAHRVTVAVPGSGLRVEGDPTRLAQVVSNLLSNAAKYTDRGGLITVLARAEDEAVVLTVTDTGIGVSPDIAPQLFELFVQGRQQRDRPAGGLGLGLAIVRNLVEQHGGTVWRAQRRTGPRQRVHRAAAASREPAARQVPVGGASASARGREPPRAGRRRQRGRRAQPGRTARSARPHHLRGPRRPLGHQRRHRVPSRFGRARHRPAGDGRLRAGRTAAGAAGAGRHHAGGADRLRPGRRPRTLEGGWLPRPPGEARGPARHGRGTGGAARRWLESKVPGGPGERTRLSDGTDGGRRFAYRWRRPARHRADRRGAHQARHLSGGLPLVDAHEADHRHRHLHARARGLPGARPHPCPFPGRLRAGVRGAGGPGHRTGPRCLGDGRRAGGAHRGRLRRRHHRPLRIAGGPPARLRCAFPLALAPRRCC